MTMRRLLTFSANNPATAINTSKLELSAVWHLVKCCFTLFDTVGLFKCFQLHENYLRIKLGSLHSAFVRVKVMLDVDEWFHFFGVEEMSCTSKRAERGLSGLSH